MPGATPVSESDSAMVPALMSGDPNTDNPDEPVMVSAVMPLPVALPFEADRTRPKASTTMLASAKVPAATPDGANPMVTRCESEPNAMPLPARSERN